MEANMAQLVVGLTGGIASGKSTVAEMFQALGVEIIDADQVARDLVKPGTPALDSIIDHFGAGIIQVDGTLHRKALRERIFTFPEDRVWLEDLLHPMIRQAMHEEAKNSKADYCMLVIPLLTNLSHYPLIQKVLVVDIEEAIQLERLQNRDALTLAQAQKILAAQPARQTRLALADDVILNNQNHQALAEDVKVLHEKYLNYVKPG